MASTYLSLRYHVIFATKEREPCIAPAWRPQLHRYLGGIVNQLGGNAHKVGGTGDHVHLLVELRATHVLADFMRDLKRGSSSWVHSEVSLKTFAWQEGYAAITVSPSAVDEVRLYIENQEEHHRHRSSREELKLILDRAGIPYDARFFE
jgi:REP element-mobilizing transposase RayT